MKDPHVILIYVHTTYGRDKYILSNHIVTYKITTMVCKMEKKYTKLTEGKIGEYSLNWKIKEKFPPAMFKLRSKRRILIM